MCVGLLSAIKQKRMILKELINSGIIIKKLEHFRTYRYIPEHSRRSSQDKRDNRDNKNNKENKANKDNKDNKKNKDFVQPKK